MASKKGSLLSAITIKGAVPDRDEDKYSPKTSKSRLQLLGFMVVMLLLIVGVMVMQESSAKNLAGSYGLDDLADKPAKLLETVGTQMGEIYKKASDTELPDNVGNILEKLRVAEAEIRKANQREREFRSKTEQELSELRTELTDARTTIGRIQNQPAAIPDPPKRRRGEKPPVAEPADEPEVDEEEADEMPSLHKEVAGLLDDEMVVEDEDVIKRGEGYPYLSSDMGGPALVEPYDVAAHSKQPISDEARKRMKAVRNAMRHAYKGYKDFAWGKDELKPVSKSTENAYGLGLTLIDALDTLWIMDLKDEFEESVGWIKNNLNFKKKVDNRDISMFETMIRVVGGLLSAYELCADKKLLDTVEALVKLMMPVFDTKNGIPNSLVNLKTGETSTYGWTHQSAVLSEAGSVQMELRALSRYTGNNRYAEAADKAFFAIRDTPNKPFPGLYPIYLTVNTKPKFTSNMISVGAMGDSFYEYMLKVYLLTGKTDPRWLDMYKESSQGIFDHVIKETEGWYHTTEISGRKANNVMEHLCCFFGGLFGMAYDQVKDELDNPAQHLKMAERLTETCFQSYNMTATGIGPEAMVFGKGKGMVPEARRQYQLRPETVESLFYLWRITGDKKYQDMGWQIFQSIEKNTKIPSGGYSGLKDVTMMPPVYNDKMDSFFLAETLKYLYLLFSPRDLISLNEFQFNTEAHPYRIFNPTL